MNTIESHSTLNPYDKDDTCARFVIDEIDVPFIMYDVTIQGFKYTFSAWIKAETAASITVLGSTFQLSTSWQKYTLTFDATDENIPIFFDANGTYYFYHTQLELGLVPTDWTPSPEDVDETVEQAANSANTANERITTAESLIQQLSNSISMLVVDENGGSLMTQTPEGNWTFSMAETNAAASALAGIVDDLQNQTNDTRSTVATLQQALNDHGATLEYVNITTYEDEPCIELGESDSDFKLLITNTRIMFRHGSSTPTYINTNGLVTQNIEVEGEIVQGGYVMMRMSDDGWGLLWKGVSS